MANPATGGAATSRRMNPCTARPRSSPAPPNCRRPPDTGFEVAFAGRSNAGKSSAINALCDQKTLARTSKTPGRTQLLNFFAVDERRRIVDPARLGYARVALDIKREWRGSLAAYLGRDCLRG